MNDATGNPGVFQSIAMPLPRRERLDIHAEERLAVRRRARLQTRFLPVGATDERERTPGDRAGVCAGRIGEVERLSERKLRQGDARQNHGCARRGRERQRDFDELFHYQSALGDRWHEADEEGGSHASQCGRCQPGAIPTRCGQEGAALVRAGG